MARGPSDHGRVAADELINRVSSHLLGGTHDAPTLLAELDALSPRELVRFDQRSRSGLPWGSVARMPPGRLKDVLELFAPSGYVRQDAVERARLTPFTTRVLVLRCADWVAPVRVSAFARLRACDRALLVAALPLVSWVVDEWTRGDLLRELLDERLTDGDLRALTRDGDAGLRRSAWRRLALRTALTPADAQRAVVDEDVVVREIVVRGLPALPALERRVLAELLLEDRIGRIAAKALGELVQLDGADRILPALTARSATVRRAARDWARVRDVDARAVYLGREPGDAMALLALAEIGDPRDVDRFRAMLTHTRAQVRDAGLRALAKHDRPAARRVALERLIAGHGRAATRVLRAGAPDDAEVEALSALALDADRTWEERRRALALLRRGTWTHFTVALEAGLAGDVPVPQGRPSAHLRPRLARQLDQVTSPRRETLAVVLR